MIPAPVAIAVLFALNGRTGEGIAAGIALLALLALLDALDPPR